MFRTMCVRITTTVLLSSSALLVACSSSDRQASPTADRAIEANQPADDSPGMKAYIDPKTGQIGEPTDAQIAEMERKANAQAGAPVEPKRTVVKMRNGGTMVILDDNPQTPMQACVDAQGNMKVDHNCQSEKPKQDPKGDKR